MYMSASLRVCSPNMVTPPCYQPDTRRHVNSVSVTPSPSLPAHPPLQPNHRHQRTHGTGHAWAVWTPHQPASHTTIPNVRPPRITNLQRPHPAGSSTQTTHTERANKSATHTHMVMANGVDGWRLGVQCHGGGLARGYTTGCTWVAVWTTRSAMHEGNTNVHNAWTVT